MLNPPLNSMGEPLRVEGEYFVMKRGGAEFEFKVERGSKYTGKGEMILTTCRVICLNNKNNSAFKAFDLPISLISQEGFEQPIFGANYICGKCKPLMNILPGNISFKIWFMNGGCGTFAPAYLKMVASCRRNKNRGIEQKLMSTVQNGTYRKTAYIDPNDPSVIYLQQPQLAQNIQYNPMGYTPIQQQPPSMNQPNNPMMNNNMNANNNYYQGNYNQNNMNNNYYQGNYNQNNANNNYQGNYNQNNANNNYQGNYNNANTNNNCYQGNMNNNYQGNYNQNNANNNYMNNNINNEAENKYPSLDELNNNDNAAAPQPAYPNQGIQGLNNVINDQNNNNSGGKYFGFFGPSLQQNPNRPNNNQ